MPRGDVKLNELFKYCWEGAGTKNDGDPLLLFSDLISKYNLHPITLHAKQNQSLEELKEFNKIWPTLYFHKNSDQHKKQELELSHDEICQIMQAVLLGKEGNGDAIVFCPKTGQIISRASDEAKKQHKKNQDKDTGQLSLKQNPLCTPILLAIQGVRRCAATGHGMERVQPFKMDNIFAQATICSL